MGLLIEGLKDTSTPENRILRKVLTLCLLGSIGLLVYRHFVLGFSSVNSMIGSLISVLTLLFVFGLLGGAVMADIYRNFLSHIGANEFRPSFSTFVIEWLVALAAPIAGSILGIVLLGFGDQI